MDPRLSFELPDRVTKISILIGKHNSRYYWSVLREHALFTLRNLLNNNRENQAVVDAIKPVGTWDESGILRDILGASK